MGFGPTELILEYQASKLFEYDRMEKLLEGIKDVIVYTFGLNIPNRIEPTGGFKDTSTMTEEELKAFTPFAFFVAHREMIKKFFDHQKDHEVTVSALSDAEFEKQSRAMQAQLAKDGDMVPASDNSKPPDTDDPAKLDEWLAQMNMPAAPPPSEWMARHKEELENAGVLVMDKDMGSPVPGSKKKVKVSEDG